MFGSVAQLSKKHLKYLNQVDGFLLAIPDELSTLHTTYNPHFLGLDNGSALWTSNVVENASLYGRAGGTASGMRYTSRISVYKVCWPKGCANSNILATVDQAVFDGVDVLSLSLGSDPKPFYDDFIAIASFGETKKGIFVTCSTCKEGPSPSTVSNGAP
ncbi:hypothetical protein JHK86_003623 [Glycine max]|nr:hypothetical protein JHK86_003623 [Glycine max]